MNKIFTPVLFVLVSFSLICLSHFTHSAAAKEENQEMPTVTLEVVRAFDSRLPALSDEDMKQVLEEAKKFISAKLGGDIIINFHDNGTLSLEELFKNNAYQKSKFYETLVLHKFDLLADKKTHLLQDASIKAQVVEFLKQWDIPALSQFFPGSAIKNYDDVFQNLMKVHHVKIKWLKTLKTKDGDSLVVLPPQPFQSYVEWISFMEWQDTYDIVFTNTLIVYDFLLEPYPHSVTKHAKVGGSSFNSPKRMPLDGRSLMVNIFEEYGNVEGINNVTKAVAKELKNKALGGFYLAHEFGHAFYMLPDVYDHGDACLMNSSFDSMDADEGYQMLASDLSHCMKCHAWVAAKEYIVKAQLAYKRKEYAESGQLYFKAADATPKIIDGNYKAYIKSLYEKALDAFTKASDTGGIKKCNEQLEKLSE